MKLFLALLMLAAALLTPLCVRAEEPLPVSIRSAATPSDGGPASGRSPRAWRLADAARMSVGAAELKLEVAPTRWGVTMSLSY